MSCRLAGDRDRPSQDSLNNFSDSEVDLVLRRVGAVNAPIAVAGRYMHVPQYRPTHDPVLNILGHSFYRAMHFSAKRGIEIVCCPSVCLSARLSVL